MKKILFAVLFILIVCSNAQATVTFTSGYWSSTFDCADWGSVTNCTSPYPCGGVWSLNQCLACNGNEATITSAANYSGGAGGKGYRTWYASPKNNHAGELALSFSSQSEIWLRWYAKFNSPMTGETGNSFKNIYLMGPANFWYWGFYDGDHTALIRQITDTGQSTEYSSANTGFASIASDNQWHCYEIHFKMDTNNANGVWDTWIDGVNVHHQTGLDLGTGPTVDWITFFANHEFFSNSTAASVDIDDVAMAIPSHFALGNGVVDAQNRPMIGPISWSSTDTTAPSIGTTSPSGEQICLSEGTQTTRIQAIVTDASGPINCEFSTNSGFTYGTGTDMLPSNGGSGANFYYDLTGQACGQSYNYHMKCEDSASTPNVNSTATAISYSIGTYAVDSTAPIIGSVGPSGEQTCIYDPRDMTVTAYNVTDDSPSISCKISSINDFNFATQGSVMTPSGTGASGEDHSYTFSGASQLACDASYSYYVKCQDSAASPNTSVQSTAGFSIAEQGTANLLLYEGFENNSFSTRGWYDGAPTSASITSGGQYGNCGVFTWASSATTPASSGWQTIRNSFSATDELFVRVYFKFPDSWVGSHRAYHPHILYFPSTLDTEYTALAYNYLQTYLEVGGSQYGLTPTINLQDGINVNTSSTPPWDATGTTETRSVNYCNGYLASQDQGLYQICYSLGGGEYYSSTTWQSAVDASKNEWQKLEMYLKMNSTPGSTAVADGIMYLWINDTIVIEKTNVVYRTGARSTLGWDKIVIAPYIGDGSPATQTMYIDELYVYDGMMGSNPDPPVTPAAYVGRGGAGTDNRSPAGTENRREAAE